jgi:hypothetical protein
MVLSLLVGRLEPFNLGPLFDGVGGASVVLDDRSRLLLNLCRVDISKKARL